MTQDNMTLVAVYGSLREGEGNHRLLDGCDLLSRELSVDEFTMHSLGGFPALTAGKSSVVIELYNVNEETFARLDRLEGYPTFYNRREIPTSRGNAWVYYMATIPKRDNIKVVAGGDWSEYRRTA